MLGMLLVGSTAMQQAATSHPVGSAVGLVSLKGQVMPLEAAGEARPGGHATCRSSPPCVSA